jgi:hypothetical protein
MENHSIAEVRGVQNVVISWNPKTMNLHLLRRGAVSSLKKELGCCSYSHKIHMLNCMMNKYKANTKEIVGYKLW